MARRSTRGSTRAALQSVSGEELILEGAFIAGREALRTGKKKPAGVVASGVVSVLNRV
jgi:hypothetical protein